jgi:hypothetical protein
MQQPYGFFAPLGWGACRVRAWALKYQCPNLRQKFYKSEVWEEIILGNDVISGDYSFFVL